MFDSVWLSNQLKSELIFQGKLGNFRKKLRTSLADKERKGEHMAGRFFGPFNNRVFSGFRGVWDQGTITFPRPILGPFFRNVPLTRENADDFRKVVATLISDAKELRETPSKEKYKYFPTGGMIPLGYRVPWSHWFLRSFYLFASKGAKEGLLSEEAYGEKRDGLALVRDFPFQAHFINDPLSREVTLMTAPSAGGFEIGAIVEDVMQEDVGVQGLVILDACNEVRTESYSWYISWNDFAGLCHFFDLPRETPLPAVAMRLAHFIYYESGQYSPEELGGPFLKEDRRDDGWVVTSPRHIPAPPEGLPGGPVFEMRFNTLLGWDRDPKKGGRKGIRIDMHRPPSRKDRPLMPLAPALLQLVKRSFRGRQFTV